MPFLRQFGSTVQRFIMMGALLVSPLLFVTPVVAQTQDQNAAISQGFQTNETNVAFGALMSISSNDAHTVELASIDTADQTVGIVGDKPLIELTTENKEIQIVTSGISLALVSTINGEVKNGDKITASPIDGVGMKTTRSSVIVGTAQADLASVKLTEQQITDTNGQRQTVQVGAIPIQVNVTYYATPDERTSFLPPFVQDFANTLAGREVSLVRVLAATLVLLLALVSIAVLLYSSVQSSIISIGRNPLSEGAVRKGLFQVGATIFGILLLTVIAIYLILRL